MGRLDILVANAGVMWLAPTLETPLKRWELCLRVNLTGVFLVTRAALPHILTQASGSLIAITTNGVRMTELGANAYWVSKAGVERYYTGLATELAPSNVAVNCLAPVAESAPEPDLSHASACCQYVYSAPGGRPAMATSLPDASVRTMMCASPSRLSAYASRCPVGSRAVSSTSTSGSTTKLICPLATSSRAGAASSRPVSVRKYRKRPSGLHSGRS